CRTSWCRCCRICSRSWSWQVPSAGPTPQPRTDNPMSAPEAPVFEARGIVKRFGALVANDHVDLQLFPGEVLSLLGENGAGKTTLMNVLYGLTSPDEGEIVLEGQVVQIDSPRRAIERGIGMGHQYFILVPPLPAAVNPMP